MCGEAKAMYVVAEYPFKSLKEEIEERVILRDYFVEGEIWSILYSALKALSFLWRASVLYNAICSKNILISAEGIIKLNDPWLNAPDVSEAFVCRDDELSRYLAPEITITRM